MLCSTIRDMARSIADLPNSTIITAQDELNYLQESYLDVYTKILENNDDFYLKDFVYTVTSANQDPNNIYDYLVTLPFDFYRLRFIDYQYGANWNRMDKFNPDLRNVTGTSPRYRFKDTKLWVHNSTLNTGNLVIRVSYYPVPQTLTLSSNLIYPSEVAYKLMYYYMAKMMKTKIGSDFSQIEKLIGDSMAILEGSLNRDDANYNQINNFYNREWQF